MLKAALNIFLTLTLFSTLILSDGGLRKRRYMRVTFISPVSLLKRRALQCGCCVNSLSFTVIESDSIAASRFSVTLLRVFL